MQRHKEDSGNVCRDHEDQIWNHKKAKTRMEDYETNNVSSIKCFVSNLNVYLSPIYLDQTKRLSLFCSGCLRFDLEVYHVWAWLTLVEFSRPKFDLSVSWS